MAGYVIKYGSDILYQGGDDTKPIHDAKLTMKTDYISELTFVVPPTHPMRNSLDYYDHANPVQVYFDNEPLFAGFITRMSNTFKTELEVRCVSYMQLLANAYARIPEWLQNEGMNRVMQANDLFSAVISYYNSLVTHIPNIGHDLTFTVGHNLSDNEVGYEDSYHRTVIEAAASTPTSILDILADSIIEPYNCMIGVYYEGATRMIGLWSSAPLVSDQVIKFGENMTQFVINIDTENMANACHPIGGSVRLYNKTNAKYFETAGNQAGTNSSSFRIRSTGSAFTAEKGDILSIQDVDYQFAEDTTVTTAQDGVVVKIEGTKIASQSSLSNGVAGYWVERGTESTNATLTLGRMADGWIDGTFYKLGEIVFHAQYAAQYGLKMFTFSASDILLVSDLLSRAKSEIVPKLYSDITLGVSGVDMALYMDGYRHLLAGQKVRVISEPHGFDSVMQVTEASLSLDNPSATKYILGPVPKTATKRIKDARTDTRDVRDMIVYDINNVVKSSQIMELR